MSDAYQPIQMMPAEHGWKACYKCDSGVIVEDVVMWAIVEPMGRHVDGRHIPRDPFDFNQIHGFTCTDLGIESAEMAANFVGYLPPGQSVDEQPWADSIPTAVPEDDHA